MKRIPKRVRSGLGPDVNFYVLIIQHVRSLEFVRALSRLRRWMVSRFLRHGERPAPLDVASRSAKRTPPAPGRWPRARACMHAPRKNFSRRNGARHLGRRTHINSPSRPVASLDVKVSAGFCHARNEKRAIICVCCTLRHAPSKKTVPSNVQNNRRTSSVSLDFRFLLILTYY